MTLIETPMGNTIETHEDLHYGFHQGFIYGLHRCLNQNLMYGLHPGLIYDLDQDISQTWMKTFRRLGSKHFVNLDQDIS
ncbi:hypothetical protein PV325_011600 [Microctonus aethiopoides]|nr:hypothetical protein PV325_011600 [Microctonus aethiopoides]